MNSFNMFDDEDRDEYRPGRLERVAAWPGAGSIKGVGFLWATDQDVFAVAGSTSLRNLTTLSFAHNDLTDAAAAALAAWPLAGGLENVSLEDGLITDAGAAALAGSPHLGQLKMLWLTGTDITPAGVALLRQRFGSAVLT